MYPKKPKSTGNDNYMGKYKVFFSYLSIFKTY